MEHWCSLSCSHKPTSCPYPGPDKSSSRPNSYLLKIHLNIIFLSMPRSSKLTLSLTLSHLKPVQIANLLHVPHAQPILFLLFRSPEYCCVWSTDYEAPKCSVFSSSLIIHPSSKPPNTLGLFSSFHASYRLQSIVNSICNWIKIDQLMSLTLLFAQHVSNASTFIFRSLRLCVGIPLCKDRVI
jgi:hypothetical protein